MKGCPSYARRLRDLIEVWTAVDMACLHSRQHREPWRYECAIIFDNDASPKHLSVDADSTSYMHDENQVTLLTRRRNRA